MKKVTQAKTLKPATQKTGRTVTVSPGSVRSLYFLTGLLAALLYANTLSHDFTVDDGTVMENNTIVKKGISAVPEIFSTRYRAGFWDRKENMYRPLSLVMFAAEWQITGGKPWLGHLVNVLMYVSICVLLVHLFRKLLRKHHPLIPFLAALLFTVHPLHTEVVANIKSRDEILCLLFSVFGMLSALKYAETKKILMMILSALFIFIALLSKENAIAMVAVIPLMIWFFSDTGFKQLGLSVAILLVLSGVYFLIRSAVLSGLGNQAELQLINNSMLGAEGFARFMMACYLIGKYLLMLVVPYPLSFDYSYNQISTEVAGSPLAWLSLLVSLVLVGYAVAGVRKKNPLSFAIFFFFGTLALVSNIFFLIEATFAERFLFMPSVGFAFAAAILLSKVMKGNPSVKQFFSLKSNTAWAVLTLVVLVLFSFKTISRNSDWKNNLALLEADVKTCPKSARIRYAYGSAILFERAIPEKNENKKNQLLDEAIAQLTKGVSILNTYADAYYHLGLAYKARGNYPNAIHAFESAKRSKTWTNADFYIASGLSYGGASRYSEAIADFKKALEYNPQSYEAYNNAGMYFNEASMTDSALVYLNKSVSLQPDFASAYYNLGNTYAKRGNFNEAISNYEKAIAIDSLYEDAYNNTGNSYAAMKNYDKALDYYKKAVKINPANSKALNNIGVTYFMLGDTVNAKKYLHQGSGQ
ncbi:MAG: tetratricopeptide repeat protein [Bacteroidia bacterium]|nr:tetratricopeptide repeat protein [Bacteroidia bacterium]MCZ2278479.1 tetratricopeptide repeat protein [Bacteroidia bacterium]